MMSETTLKADNRDARNTVKLTLARAADEIQKAIREYDEGEIDVKNNSSYSSVDLSSDLTVEVSEERILIKRESGTVSAVVKEDSKISSRVENFQTLCESGVPLYELEGTDVITANDDENEDGEPVTDSGETRVESVSELVDELEQKDTDFGTLADGERFQILVEYETDAGNTRSRSGEVWAVDSDIGVSSESRIRFSEDAGEVDEDPYYIRVKNGSAVLVSVSENGTHTELGPVTGFTTDREDPKPMTDGGQVVVDAHELTEGDSVTVECFPLPIRGSDEYPREVSGEVTSVDHMETREFHETGEVVITASTGAYRLTYEPGIQSIAVIADADDETVFADVTALAREPEDSEDRRVMTDGGVERDSGSVQMSEPAPTRVSKGFVPFVERALDDRDAREALGPARSSGREPRGSDSGTAWSAANHAGERVSGQRHPMID